MILHDVDITLDCAGTMDNQILTKYKETQMLFHKDNETIRFFIMINQKQ